MGIPFDPQDFDPLDYDPMPHEGSWLRRWRPAIISAAIFSLVVGTVVIARDSENSSVSTTTQPPILTTALGEDVTAVALTRTLERGMRGPDVRRVQQRLTDLRFMPGRIDGIYGGDTIMAVWAFQAVALGMKRETITDFVTPVLWDAMRGPVNIMARRPNATPTHVEVYLDGQAMVVFKDKEPALITHISSGSNEVWCEEVAIDPGELGNATKKQVKRAECGVSWTPSGKYKFYMRKYGLYESQLGTMWNPVYFNYGIAVHGALNVPNTPASHGCIRIPIFVSEVFPALVEYSDEIYVFDGVKEPEEYGSPPPRFNKLWTPGKPWPTFDLSGTGITTTTTIPTTTTSSTTTTTTAPRRTTTTVPTTTVVPTTPATTIP